MQNSHPRESLLSNLTSIKLGIVACGNKTHETFGKISTTDLDTAMMRYLVSWGASSPDFTLASLDVTAAFLNAPLPGGQSGDPQASQHTLQASASTSWLCMVGAQSHLRFERSTQPMVRRKDRHDDQTHLLF